MTREEHIAWCKKRAIEEYDFYTGSDKQRNGLISIMSDLSKHPETSSRMLQELCLIHMTIPMDRQRFVEFINGFN